VGNTLELSAQALDGASLQWSISTSQWGSGLAAIPGEPDKRLYTAGNLAGTTVPFPIDIVEVKNRNTGARAFIYILIKKIGLLTQPMVLDESSDPQSGKARFYLMGEDGPIEAVPGEVTITGELLLGDGSFDGATGIYTEPETIMPGSLAVISLTADFGEAKLRGYTALPLPISKYRELIEAVNHTILGT
jgi:hypothetical protein